MKWDHSFMVYVAMAAWISICVVVLLAILDGAYHDFWLR